MAYKYSDRTWRRTRLAVLHRDRWVCRLCGRPIDRTAAPGSAMAASVDHVVELSAGGGHDPGNLVACHVGCNTAKELRRRAGRRYPVRRTW